MRQRCSFPTAASLPTMQAPQQCKFLKMQVAKGADLARRARAGVGTCAPETCRGAAEGPHCDFQPTWGATGGGLGGRLASPARQISAVDKLWRASAPPRRPRGSKRGFRWLLRGGLRAGQSCPHSVRLGANCEHAEPVRPIMTGGAPRGRTGARSSSTRLTVGLVDVENSSARPLTARAADFIFARQTPANACSRRGARPQRGTGRSRAASESTSRGRCRTRRRAARTRPTRAP